MSDAALLSEYKARHEAVLRPLARKLAEHLQGSVQGIARVDRVAARAKSPDRFIAKAAKVMDDGSPKYNEPLSQIQDLVGARIIVFYLDDVETVSQAIDAYYRRIEQRDLIPRVRQRIRLCRQALHPRVPRGPLRGRRRPIEDAGVFRAPNQDAVPARVERGGA